MGENIVHEMLLVTNGSFSSSWGDIICIKNVQGIMTSCCCTQLAIEGTPLCFILQFWVVRKVDFNAMPKTGRRFAGIEGTNEDGVVESGVGAGAMVSMTLRRWIA